MNKYNLDLEHAEFNKNGLASKAGWIKTYIAHPETGEFIGSTMEYILFDVSTSAGSYVDVPEIPTESGLAVVRSKNKKTWVIEADYRGVTAYHTETRQEIKIDFIGDLPVYLTLLSPESEFDKWDGNAWTADAEAQHVADVAEAESKKVGLVREANEQINYLQDAVDVEVATEAEMVALIGWKKYRVSVTRVDTSTAPDIEWPVKP